MQAVCVFSPHLGVAHGCIAFVFSPKWHSPSLCFFVKKVLAVQAVLYSMPLVAGNRHGIYTYSTNVNLYVLLVNGLISPCG